MTTTQISLAVNKDVRTVRRWVAKLTDKVSSIADKVSSSSPMNPADFNLEETLEIIKKGLGVNAADLFAENARAKANIAPKNEVLDYEKLATLIATAVTTALASVAGVAKEQQLQIEAPITHMSLSGYCRVHEIDYDNTNWLRSKAIVIKGICWERGLVVEKVPDDRWGTVNSYPISVLDDYFGI